MKSERKDFYVVIIEDQEGGKSQVFDTMYLYSMAYSGEIWLTFLKVIWRKKARIGVFSFAIQRR